MAESCGYCGASFGGPADLVAHVNRTHRGGREEASLAMNPESRRPGVVCGLCGRRFPRPKSLMRHLLSPDAHPNRGGSSTPALPSSA
jgi:uncharacterized C2H2 Zn-finger protein